MLNASGLFQDIRGLSRGPSASGGTNFHMHTHTQQKKVRSRDASEFDLSWFSDAREAVSRHGSWKIFDSRKRSNFIPRSSVCTPVHEKNSVFSESLSPTTACVVTFIPPSSIEAVCHAALVQAPPAASESVQIRTKKRPGRV